jgi:hypothetical protein
MTLQLLPSEVPYIRGIFYFFYPCIENIFEALLISNGKTSIVRYRTLSFFAFRFFKKRMFAFFRDFKCKISIEPVRFASILVHV